MSVMTTNYTDSALALNTQFYYTVVAMNAGGISGNSTIVVTPPSAPAILTANPGNAKITLNWSAAVGATGYYLYRGTSSGNEPTVVAANYTGTSYTNTGLINGTKYYYVVAATNTGGLGPKSPEASATPTPARSIIWKGNGTNNVWDLSTTANWQTNNQSTVFNEDDIVTFDDTGTNNVPVTLKGTLQSSLLTVDATKDYIFSGSGAIGGTNGLVKDGSGTLTLATANTYTGDTTISDGTLKLLVTGLTHRWSFNGNLADSVGGQTASIVDVGANNVTVTATNITLAGGTQATSDYINLGANLLPNTTASITIEIWATQNAVQNWGRIFDFGSSTTEYLIMSWTKGTVLASDRVEWRDGVTSTSDNTCQPYTVGTEFHIAMVIEPGAGASGTTRVTWYRAESTNSTLGAARGTFDTANALASFSNVNGWLGRSEFPDNTASASYNEVRLWNRAMSATELQASHVAGPNAAMAPSLPVTTALELNSSTAKLDNQSGQTQTSASLTGVAGSEVKLTTGGFATGGDNSSTTFAGFFSGINGFAKQGSGTLTLSGVNTHTGPTLVSAGTLIMDGDNTAATGAVTVVSGATIGGSGILGGATTIQSGGKLAPGIGALSFSNALTLGGTTVMEISHDLQTNDLIIKSGTLTYSGALLVTNISGPLATGDSFQLFSADSYNGAFASVSLPTLPVGLAWNTNSLNTAGTLSVLLTTKPIINSVSLSGNGLVLNGSGGVGNANYYLLGSTNLTLPISSWTILLTNQFDASGNFNCTNTINPGWPQNFYLLQLQ